MWPVSAIVEMNTQNAKKALAKASFILRVIVHNRACDQEAMKLGISGPGAQQSRELLRTTAMVHWALSAIFMKGRSITLMAQQESDPTTITVRWFAPTILARRPR